MDNYKETTDSATNSTISLLDQLTGEDGLIAKIDEEADTVRKSTEAWSSYYSELIEEVIPSIEVLIESIDEVIERASKQIDVNVVTHYSVDGIGAGSYAATGSYSSGSSSGSNSGSGSNSNSGSSSGNQPRANNTSTAGSTSNWYQVKTDTTGATWKNKKTGQVQYAFATGGYTGTWDGPDTEENGKLAYLHQKELVLNAGDTENMLAAIKLIRQISNSIDLRAASQTSTSGIISPSYLGTDQIFEQEVTIHAEFPNATDHNEIEEAFNNLINRASQYAGRQNLMNRN